MVLSVSRHEYPVPKSQTEEIDLKRNGTLRAVAKCLHMREYALYINPIMSRNPSVVEIHRTPQNVKSLQARNPS